MGQVSQIEDEEERRQEALHFNDLISSDGIQGLRRRKSRLQTT